jgi:hypothetical protein
MVSRGYDQNKLFVMGRSLGGAVAIHFVNKFQQALNLRGLILENTFTSVKDVVSSYSYFL